MTKPLWTAFFHWAAFVTIASTADDLVDNNALFGFSPRQNLNFTELAEYDGYEVENHSVTTSDGYILGVYRIPSNKNCSEDKVPLVFWHGLYLSGDDCIIPGPGKAHCYIYADLCYDVWVPNSRGNRYSRRHTILNPDKNSTFWRFSFDEIALIDLPTVIDYILSKTGKSQVAYIGHAQSVSTLLILCAKQPAYNSKIKVGFGLSPTAWIDHSRFIVNKLLGVLEPVLTTANNMGVDKEILAHGGLTHSSTELLCGTSTVAYPFCSAAIFALLGYNGFQITRDVLPVIVSNAPAGTSLRNVNRWGQVRNNGFSEWDYGFVKNVIKYGKAKPPLIDLSAVTMKWIFICSENDYVGDIRDLDTLLARLPNSEYKKCILSDKTFGHLDFIYGKDVSNYITPTILSYLSTGEYKCL